jgi:hypothetical protein
MKNQVILSTPGTQRQAKCPVTVKAGDPVLLGVDPAVAINDFEAVYGGTTFELTGSYVLTVIGRSVESPITTHAINAGDKIYATGVLDVTTNVTTNLTLDANTGGTFFGTLDPQYPGAPVAAGATDTAAWVRINA